MAPIITFFNNKGRAGKTSLVYHLAWMYHKQGLRVMAADLDPQANLTAAFLEEDRLEETWLSSDTEPNTVFRSVLPLVRGSGDIATPQLEPIDEGLALLTGDLLLSGFEDDLSAEWPGCLEGKEHSFRILSAFWQLIQKAAGSHCADIILMDLGSNLGAINRAALIASDYVAVPLSPDLFSLQGLKNLGPTLRRWRTEWKQRLKKAPSGAILELPDGDIRVLGYIVLQAVERLDRPINAGWRWIERVPGCYRSAVRNESKHGMVSVSDDPYCLALLKPYQCLIPLAQEARKPIFDLKPADGAIGSHIYSVTSAYKDFKLLAQKIAAGAGVPIP
ncbi:MAG: ParA family protein [Gammaproteobacteria bacterium]|nr:ParA family protein [Gammaproteobacteria bacterium]